MESPRNSWQKVCTSPYWQITRDFTGFAFSAPVIPRDPWYGCMCVPGKANCFSSNRTHVYNICLRYLSPMPASPETLNVASHSTNEAAGSSCVMEPSAVAKTHHSDSSTARELGGKQQLAAPKRKRGRSESEVQVSGLFAAGQTMTMSLHNAPSIH